VAETVEGLVPVSSTGSWTMIAFAACPRQSPMTAVERTRLVPRLRALQGLGIKPESCRQLSAELLPAPTRAFSFLLRLSTELSFPVCRPLRIPKRTHRESLGSLVQVTIGAKGGHQMFVAEVLTPDPKFLLARANLNTEVKRGVLSLHGIAAVLAGAGHLNEGGAPYSAKSVASMLN
jgi:hypothetical protein